MQEISQDNNLNVAIYCRLSREDGDSLESSSIKNQKELLTEYAEKMSWNIYKVYVDDGYSGGNFNRPGWRELLDDIEQSKINILLTKDLSRLGRNYIEVGYYTEEYFPEKNVRYIAVNDNYDSTSDDNDITPFKNIINQWYLKDISKKVETGKHAIWSQGGFSEGTVPYGYYRADDGTRKLLIDKEVSDNVIRIFDMFLAGKGYGTIAKIMQKWRRSATHCANKWIF